MGCEKGFVDEGFAEVLFVSYIDNNHSQRITVVGWKCSM